MTKKIVVGIFCLFLFACKEKKEEPTITCLDPGVGNPGEVAYASDFKTYLQNNYSTLSNIEGWGGGSTGCTTATKNPVIFIHGNNDYASSWSKSRNAFIAQGYQPSELYAIGWGEKGQGKNLTNFHKASWIKNIRDFMLAVKAYTGKSKINVIAHSMGVTMALKAILGGNAYETYDRSGTPTNLGSPINTSIQVFLGIAGAVRGLNLCDATGYGAIYATSYNCGVNGFKKNGGFIVDLISLLGNTKPATVVSGMLSSYDEIVCTKDYKSDYITPTWGGNDPAQYNASELNCNINSFHSSLIPNYDVFWITDNKDYFASTSTYNLWKTYHLGNHFSLRDETVNMQVEIIKNNQ